MASKRQRKKQQKLKAKQREQQKRQEQFERVKQERQKRYEQLHPVKVSTPTATQKKKSDKSDKRKSLENKFRDKVNQANEILKRFDNEKARYIFDDDFGAVFDDKTIMNQKGFFRNNATQLNEKELQQRVSMLDSFIIDSESYEQDLDDLNEFGEKLGFKREGRTREEYIFDVWEFLAFAKAMMGDNVPPSKVLETIASLRFERGETLEEVKHAFYIAYMNSTDVDDLIAKFSENGVLL